MFFKRKNINPELQQKVAEAEEQQEPQQQDLTPTVTLDVQVNTEATETFQERRKLEAEAKEHAVEEAKKQLEQELAVKHYYHQRLLETLDLGLLASLEKDRARKELHDAIVQLMADDQTHALSAEGRKRVIQQIEDEVFGLGPLEPLLNDPTVSDILVNGPKHVFVERRGKLELTPRDRKSVV